VQRNASSFREGVREAALLGPPRKRVPRRVDEIYRRLEALSVCIAVTPTAAQPGGATRGVRVPIGLGRSSRHAQSWREEPEWARREPAHSFKRPLTRETSAPDRWNGGSESGRPIPRAGPEPEMGSSASRVARTRGRGLVGPSVVLADHFDCRSRREARGHERPGVKSVRKRQGLAPQVLRERGAKERRKPDRGGKVSGSVAGPASETARCKPGGRAGHSSMEGVRVVGSTVL
jgi:hypothetical protein